MNIERALTIQGWMDDPELRWLANAASCHSHIVEVGCWKGRSTVALAMNTLGMVFAVDTWLGSVEHNPPVQGLYESFLENIKGLDNILDIRKSSVEAAQSWSYGSPDMVFIDASHDYENVKADIAAWRPLVKPGGILCGHDHGYPPVHQAVHEFFDNVSTETVIWCAQL